MLSQAQAFNYTIKFTDRIKIHNEINIISVDNIPADKYYECPFINVDLKKWKYLSPGTTVLMPGFHIIKYESGRKLGRGVNDVPCDDRMEIQESQKLNELGSGRFINNNIFLEFPVPVYIKYKDATRMKFLLLEPGIKIPDGAIVRGVYKSGTDAKMMGEKYTGSVIRHRMKNPHEYQITSYGIPYLISPGSMFPITEMYIKI